MLLPIFGRHQISSGSLLQGNKVAACFIHFYLTAHFFCLSKRMCPPNGFQFVVVFVVVGIGKIFFPRQFCDVAKVVIIHKAI
jgi:hypothetical protein